MMRPGVAQMSRVQRVGAAAAGGAAGQQRSFNTGAMATLLDHDNHETRKGLREVMCCVVDRFRVSHD